MSATGEAALCAVVLRHIDAIIEGRSTAAEVAREAEPCVQAVLRRLRVLEERHRATNLFLDSIIENVPDMIFVKDAEELRFVRFNLAGERLLGYSRAEMLGKNDYDFFPREEADFFTSKDREVLAKGRMHEIEEEPIHTRSGRRWLHTKKVPILDEAGRPSHLLGISEDITERKEWAEREASHRQELERSNKELERFAYVASHDLQEPLRTVASFTQLLEHDYADQLDARARDYIQHVVDGARRMQELIRGLLAYSRLGSEASSFHEVSLDDVMRLVRYQLEQALAEAGATLVVEPLPAITGDFDQLNQLFLNLVGNALKFRRPEVPAVVRVEVEDREGERVIVVRDNGIGIDPEGGDRIFELFTRLHAMGEYPGTGIGLSICKRIVERHRGRIWFESVPGEGATFCFTLGAGSG